MKSRCQRNLMSDMECVIAISARSWKACRTGPRLVRVCVRVSLLVSGRTRRGAITAGQPRRQVLLPAQAPVWQQGRPVGTGTAARLLAGATDMPPYVITFHKAHQSRI